MIIMELKCPRCGKLQLFYSDDFEDSAYCRGVIHTSKTSSESCGYSHDAWYYPHRPVFALEYINTVPPIIGLTKFREDLSFTEEGDYPYWNDSLTMGYSSFLEKHPRWK